MQRIFLDNAATTPLDPLVIDAMVEAMRQYPGNPSSIHAEGRAARAAIEQSRKKVAQLLGASIGEVFFTSGGTESNNTALKCAVRDLGVKRIISSATEHHCVLHSLESLDHYHQVSIEFVTLDAKGRPNIQHLESLLAAEGQPKTMVSLMHANNEIGTMIDLEEVASLCQQYGALFHTDTVQSMGYYPIDVSKAPISFLTGSAHKFHGPKGIGFLYINSHNIIKPFVDGGSQERNMRGGTENLYGIIGLAKAMELAVTGRAERQEQISDVRNYFRASLERHFSDLTFNGDPDNGHYKILSVSFPANPKSDMLLLNLDIAGISVSGGSACSSGAEAGSHVIAALNGDPQRKTVRFSFSHNNTREEVDYVVEKLAAMMPEYAV